VIPSFDDQVQWGVALPIFLMAALLQQAIAPAFQLFGGHANLLLVVVAGWALIRSAEEAMIAGPPAALLAGLLGAGPIGTPLLALIAPIAMALTLRSGGAMPKLPSLCGVLCLSSVTAIVVDLIVEFLSGGRSFDFAGFIPIVAGATLLNLVIGLILYRFLCIGRKRKLVRRTRLSLS
jgi:cell shape-determining protein MreD